MLKLFLSLLISVLSLPLMAINSDAQYRIVFVHLGPNLPAYTHTAISQAKLFNPDAEIILIAHQEALNKKPSIPLSTVILPAETIVKSYVHKQFIKTSKLDKRFRKGFWFYATERLFYLDDLITQYDLKNTFHLENDNLLYTDLNDLLPIFESRYSGIAAPFENGDRGAASFIYVADKNSINKLCQFLLAKGKSGFSEMILLNLFKIEFGKNYIDHLPVLMNEYRQNYELIPLVGKNTIDPDNYSNNIDLLQSLFDACAYGQYVGGLDPRNGMEGPGYINPEAVFSCANMKIEWQMDPLGRKIPYAIFKEKKYRLNNLHIHSKNLNAYTSINFEKQGA